MPRSLSVLIDQIIVSGSNFALGIMLARSLGIEGYGYYSLIWMSVLFVSSIQLASITTPMMSLGVKKDSIIRDKYYFSMMILQWIYASIAMISIFSFFHLIALVDENWSIGDLVYKISIFIFIYLCQDFLRRYFFVRKKALFVIFMDSIAYVGSVSMAAYLMNFHELTLDNLFVIMITAYFLSVCVALFNIDAFYIDRGYLYRVAKESALYSQWITMSSIFQWGTGNFFILFSGSILGVGAIGAIRAVQNLMGLFHVVFLALENILPMEFSRVFHKKGYQATLSLLRKYLIMGFLVFIPMFLFSIFFSNELIGFVYGEDFINYAYILSWFMVIYLFIYAVTLIKYVLRATERTKSIFIAYLISTVFSMVSAHLLIQTLGLLGTMIGMVVIQIITIYIVFNELRHQKSLL
jgi:O-antigen/teichoic acid export membrane protein